MATVALAIGIMLPLLSGAIAILQAGSGRPGRSLVQRIGLGSVAWLFMNLFNLAATRTAAIGLSQCLGRELCTGHGLVLWEHGACCPVSGPIYTLVRSEELIMFASLPVFLLSALLARSRDHQESQQLDAPDEESWALIISACAWWACVFGLFALGLVTEA